MEVLRKRLFGEGNQAAKVELKGPPLHPREWSKAIDEECQK